MGISLSTVSIFANDLVKKVENKTFEVVHQLEGHKPLTPPSKVLASQQLQATGNANVMLRFRASAPGADFSKAGKELAPVNVFVDGKYYSTEAAFSEQGQNAQFAVNLGALKAGVHTVELRPAREGGPQPVISPGSISTVEASGLQQQLQKFAPLIVARKPVGRDDSPTMFHTDVPLQLRADVTGDVHGTHVITYRVSFTDEDGGTSPKGRLETYGRTIDDEWAYRVTVDGNGNRVGAGEFQYGNDDLFATRHQHRPFDGLRVGDRPVLKVNSDNNNFDQLPKGSKLPSSSGSLWSPVVVQSKPGVDGRRVVKQNPLFERLSLKELEREGRAEGLPVDWP